MNKEQWKIGDVTITKVVEMAFSAPVEFTAGLLPGATSEEIESLSWMTPTWIKDGQLGTSIHSFLIETPTLKLLVDTCVGNGKKRTMEMFSGLDTDYMQSLSHSCDASEINGVICTHLHVDHVGWNTRFADGKWVPTFPNANYYFVEEEFAHWKKFAEDHPEGTEITDPGEQMGDGTAVFEDSIQPVVDAGQARLVSPTGSITSEITLLPTFGHTPGHVAVRVDSQGQSAVITGDLMYCPCQVARPEWSAFTDFDKAAAARTRMAFVKQFADTDTIVLGTHFDTPSGGRIVTDGDTYRFIAA